ncbi:hypothetical protein [Zobellia galactanivorans]|nr:hypothetical protein [Zobellia galactanivorans]
MSLVILFSCSSCSNNLNLANINFDANFEKTISSFKIEEKREINLKSDFKFARIEPLDHLEENRNNIIYSYFISPKENQITYNGIQLGDDIVEIRTVNDKPIGFRCSTSSTENTQELLAALEQKYGIGKLIYNFKGTQYYIWESDNKIIEFNKFSTSEGTAKEAEQGMLIILKTSALKKGQWPIYKPYLDKVKMPDIRD